MDPARAAAIVLGLPAVAAIAAYVVAAATATPVAAPIVAAAALVAVAGTGLVYAWRLGPGGLSD
jgi:hypothetical protein